MSIPLKAFLGFIVFLCLTILANAQSLNDYKLKGKVKSFYKKTYEDSKDGYLDTITPSESIFVDFQNLKETKIHKKNHRINKTVKYFDENLNIVLDSAYTKRDYVEISKYYYDSKGKRIKKEDYRNDSIQSIKTYKYDRFDNLIEELTDFIGKFSHRVLYTYDSNKNNTSKYSYNNNVEFSSYIIEYNNKGQKIKDYSPETKGEYTLYKYDKKGNLIKEIEYLKNKRLEKTIYIYNSQNDLIQKKSYFRNELTNTKTYVYDSLNRKSQTISWERDIYTKPKKEVVRLDKKGRLVESKTYRADAPPIIHRFIYKNDKILQEIFDEPTDSYNQTYKIEYLYNNDYTLSSKVRFYYEDRVGENIKWRESNVEEYNYNDEKQIILIKTPELFSNYISIDTLIYENGLLIKRFDCETKTPQTTYKYDDKKRLIEKEIIGYNNRREIYKYDNDTLVYKREEIYKGNTLDYCIIKNWKYDSNKRLIEYAYNYPYFSSKVNFFYNSKGKLIRGIINDNEGNIIISDYKYKPFSKDYTIVYSDNSNIENVYYKYDDIGNLVEERHPSYLVRFEYEYYE